MNNLLLRKDLCHWSHGLQIRWQTDCHGGVTVGIYGLLASQSCYHSMLVPCQFTLWTSGRFHNLIHPFDFDRNLFDFLL